MRHARALLCVPAVTRLKEEELEVLQFLQTQGGLCTVGTWREFTAAHGHKDRVLKRLIDRGYIAAPEPGELYILTEAGHRSLKMVQKS